MLVLTLPGWMFLMLRCNLLWTAGPLDRWTAGPLDRWTDCEGVRASIFDSEFERNSFDIVVIQAGLHHLHPRLDDAIEEVHRILKPGGYFCFSEPHAGSLYDGIRNLWYSYDRSIFSENEESVDLEDMKIKNRSKFTYEVETYLGNFAYFFVLQSMVLRIPLSVKRYYAPLFMSIERLVSRVTGRRTTPLFSVRWRKK
jgi:SAM-dependent methyltransferase